ncbi:PP2C family protein-serine/threonine phosphatase [Rhabdochromatium marinum]|uniref:PP2C family protein-serine/threonine phosphatase n=1 Tax=Rhabdochromatium marinum TaxID=48729 RepID=UPI001906509D|nr:SpoIIE family protein phosphatase [Rhabdochromatium marinum]
MQILVVDDDTWMRQALVAMLSSWDYEPLEAADGEEAWTLLQQHPVSLVLCDWMMPKLDGVELCRRLRAADWPHYIYVILLTGKDQTADLIAAFEAGADDFHTKPVKAGELRVRIRAARRVLELEQALVARNQDLQGMNQALAASQARVQRDLEAAAEVQRDLLPRSAAVGLPVRLAWSLLPADELAGDSFNVFAFDARYLGFYVIDVSGHGVPAAMLSVHLARTLAPEPRPDSLVRRPETPAQKPTGRLRFGRGSPSSRAAPYRPPVEVLTRLNQSLLNDERGSLYFTMIYGILDTSSGQGELCQAGHPYPLISRANGQIDRLGEGGFPVGLLPDAEYESIDFYLAAGDRLLLYSDGATECFDATQQAFGEERLCAALTAGRDQPLEPMLQAIEQALRDWHRQAAPATTQAPGFDDDVSLLAIERE